MLEANYLHEWNVALEGVIINDFFSPPVAGRMYTYPNLVAYTILTGGKSEVHPLLKNFPTLVVADNANKNLLATHFILLKKNGLLL